MSKSWIWDIPHYYIRYIDRIPEVGFDEALHASLEECNKLLVDLPESQANTAYEEGKWTIKEVMQHVLDSERIFTYRALCIARGETRELESFDQEVYTRNSGANDRRLSEILVEFNAVRNSTRALFRSLTEEQMKVRGHASGFEAQPVFYAYLLSGHLRHHLNIIKERYL